MSNQFKSRNTNLRFENIKSEDGKKEKMEKKDQDNEKMEKRDQDNEKMEKREQDNEKREQDRRRMESYGRRNDRSLFKNENEPPKKIYFEMNNKHFPYLIKNDSNSESESLVQNNSLDFKNASLKEVPKVKLTEKLKPGWLYMKYDKDNNIKKFIMETKITLDQEALFDNKVNNAINEIIKNHYSFIENYGEDNYERDYNMESYLEMANKYSDDYEYDEYDEYYTDYYSYY